MRIAIAPLLIGTLVLAGASPATAQSKPASDQKGMSGVLGTLLSLHQRTGDGGAACFLGRSWTPEFGGRIPALGETEQENQTDRTAMRSSHDADSCRAITK